MNSNKRSIIGIMAASLEGLIGKGSSLLWHYPDELAYFKQTTKGQVMIMGRKTFEAMPASVFSDRTAIVFSRQHPLVTSVNHHAASNLDDFRVVATSLNNQQFFMVGGAQIAHLFLQENLLTEFLLTKINQSYLGDIPGGFQELARRASDERAERKSPYVSTRKSRSSRRKFLKDEEYTYLDFNFFTGWYEEIINSNENYTIIKLKKP